MTSGHALEMGHRRRLPRVCEAGWKTGGQTHVQERHRALSHVKPEGGEGGIEVEVGDVRCLPLLGYGTAKRKTPEYLHSPAICPQLIASPFQRTSCRK
jgi:hypothetical protein